MFPHPGKDTTPLALRANTDYNSVLHESVIIVSSTVANVPHVPVAERFTVDDLGYKRDGIQHVLVRVGFGDSTNLPEALRQASEAGVLLDGPTQLGSASYFLSHGSIRRTRQPGMARWRKTLFVFLAHNAANPAAVFGLPAERTVDDGCLDRDLGL